MKLDAVLILLGVALGLHPVPAVGQGASVPSGGGDIPVPAGWKIVSYTLPSGSGTIDDTQSHGQAAAAPEAVPSSAAAAEAPSQVQPANAEATDATDSASERVFQDVMPAGWHMAKVDDVLGSSPGNIGMGASPCPGKDLQSKDVGAECLAKVWSWGGCKTHVPQYEQWHSRQSLEGLMADVVQWANLPDERHRTGCYGRSPAAVQPATTPPPAAHPAKAVRTTDSSVAAAAPLPKTNPQVAHAEQNSQPAATKAVGSTESTAAASPVVSKSHEIVQQRPQVATPTATAPGPTEEQLQAAAMPRDPFMETAGLPGDISEDAPILQPVQADEEMTSITEPMLEKTAQAAMDKMMTYLPSWSSTLADMKQAEAKHQELPFVSDDALSHIASVDDLTDAMHISDQPRATSQDATLQPAPRALLAGGGVKRRPAVPGAVQRASKESHGVPTVATPDSKAMTPVGVVDAAAPVYEILPPPPQKHIAGAASSMIPAGMRARLRAHQADLRHRDRVSEVVSKEPPRVAPPRRPVKVIYHSRQLHKKLVFHRKSQQSEEMED